MALRLNLLGTFELCDCGGAPIALSTRFDQALLGYLAVHGTRAWPREHLAGLLWFNRSDVQARKSLRESLAGLRKVLGPAVVALGAKRSSILSFTPTMIEVDTLRLETLSRSEATHTLEQAAALYRGPLMQGLSIRSPDYEDWLRCERERFADLAYGCIARLCEMHISNRAWTPALDAARRLATIDPLREAGHRLLMRSLPGAGRRSEALRQYDELAHFLRQQLAVRPDAETETLRQSIKNGPAEVTLPVRDCHAVTGMADAAACRTKPARPGLVVLPLKDMEGSTDDSLPLGLTEELIGALAAYRWLWVISLLQALMYRDRAIDPADLGRELGVSYAVYGGVRQLGSSFRVLPAGAGGASTSTGPLMAGSGAAATAGAAGATPKWLATGPLLAHLCRLARCTKWVGQLGYFGRAAHVIGTAVRDPNRKSPSTFGVMHNALSRRGA